MVEETPVIAELPEAGRPDGWYTATCSPCRRAWPINCESGSPVAPSSRCSSATLATVAASAVVCRVKSLRSSLATCKPSGTATMPSRNTTSAITVSVILRAISACRSRAAEPETASVDRLDEAGQPELAPKRGDVDVEHLSRSVPVRVPGGLKHLLAAH